MSWSEQTVASQGGKRASRRVLSSSEMCGNESAVVTTDPSTSPASLGCGGDGAVRVRSVGETPLADVCRDRLGPDSGSKTGVGGALRTGGSISAA